VVGASEAGLTRLGELSQAELAAAGGTAPPATSFADLLRRPAKAERAAAPEALKEPAERVAEAKDQGDPP
jgi:hypothetical protein